MGQYFELINVDREETSPESGIKIGEFFFDEFPGLIEALRLPTLPREVNAWLMCGKVALQPGPFGKLSPEVIDMVYAQFTSDDDLEHVIRLAITCKRLLAVGKPHLLRLLQAYHACWAGCRLICLGEYTINDAALPVGFLTDAEKHKIATTEIPVLGEPDEYRKCLALHACELYSHRYGTRESFDPRWAYTDRRMRALRKMHKEDGDAQRLLELDMFNTLYKYAPTYPNGIIVLCNLSKAEYVREDRLTVMERTNMFGLIHGLMSRICWATSRDISFYCGDEYMERLVKGPWAGDRFCIATLKEMPLLKIGAGKEWKDVTAEVDELLLHLWKANQMYDDY
ncbi:hypothetical protein C8Q76DRAFT_670580 [Earliella scabrosa]|nr:hypothetical protein C8Q76DRAFT_670580 [Earliella scabrosa]